MYTIPAVGDTTQVLGVCLYKSLNTSRCIPGGTSCMTD